MTADPSLRPFWSDAVVEADAGCTLLREDHYRDNVTDGRRHERLPRLLGPALVAKSDLRYLIVNSSRIQAVSMTIGAFANARRCSSILPSEDE
jgi:hypothetical protein